MINIKDKWFLKILFLLLFTITVSNSLNRVDGTDLSLVFPFHGALSPFHGALSTKNNLFELKRVAKLRALKNSFPPPGYESNEGQFSFRLTLVNGPQVKTKIESLKKFIWPGCLKAT